MKVYLGQINPTPLDFDGNTKQHIEGYLEASKEGCDIAIFPELGIPGYLCADAIYKRSFVKKNKKCLKALRQITEGQKTYLVVGYIDVNLSGDGKHFKNMLAVIHDGEIIGTYQKWLLPFYDVFDEPRYFAPGTETLVIKIKDKRVGFTICEDLWNDKGQDDYNHRDNPIQRYRELGTQVLVNISASPYARGKPQKRSRMIKDIAQDFEALIYVNQYGAQDELVFDGRSMIVVNGTCKFMVTPPMLPQWEQPARVSDTDKNNMPYLNEHYADDHLKMALLGLYDYCRKTGFKDFVIGSSGGIDSAVVIAMAATVFDPHHIHPIAMPGPYSSDRSWQDAAKLHANLGTNSYVRRIDVESDLQLNAELLLGVVDNHNKVADENIQARARGNVVMYFANAINALALTTGNKTEMALGYCTLYGDMNGGFNPLVDVEKLQVYEFARQLNKIHRKEMIPQTIIDAAPSAELAPGQTDEDSLLPYKILDYIVRAYVEDYADTWCEFGEWVDEMFHLSTDQTLDVLDLIKWKNNANNIEKYDAMIRRIDIMEFKRRQATIGTRLTPKAFGVGRRLPIVKG